MHLAPMRFTKIEGTSVAVTVTSAVEAKAALKELRHKKRELKFLRSALVREHKARRARQGQGKGKGKGKRGKGKIEPGMLATFVSDLKWGVAALANGGTVQRGQPVRGLAEIERELRAADEMLHNIEGCILQLQGKLLTLG